MESEAAADGDAASRGSEPQAAEPATVGMRLRAGREALDLSIEKIADELRIEEHVLVALEDDRLAELSVAPVFVKGYIKQYSRLLQLDYDSLRDAFDAQTSDADVSLQPNTSIRLRDERQITIWIVAAIAIALVCAALAVWWFSAEDPLDFSLSRDSGVSDVADDAPVVSGTASTPVAVPASSSPAPSSSQSGQQAQPVPVEPEVSTVAAAPPPTAQPVLQSSESTPQVTREPVAQVDAAVDEQAEPAPVETAAAEPPPGAVIVEFSFADGSWFELSDALDRRLHYDLVAPGSALSFDVVPPARVVVGNADAVSIAVDSRAFAIPQSSLRGNVASFQIDPQQD